MEMDGIMKMVSGNPLFYPEITTLFNANAVIVSNTVQ